MNQAKAERGTPKIQEARRQQILALLRKHRTLSDRKLASLLKVSRRTIWRDIRALAADGQPIVTRHGEGFALAAEQGLPALALTHEDALTLVLILEIAARTIGDSLRPRLFALQEKIETILPRATGERWRAATADILVASASSLWDIIDHPMARKLQEALDRGGTVCVSLRPAQKTGQATEVLLEPRALSLQGDGWFLSAYGGKPKKRLTIPIRRILGLKESEAAPPAGVTAEEAAAGPTGETHS